MSWRFAFVTKTTGRAKELVEEQRKNAWVPGPVCDYIVAAVDNLEADTHDKLISVKSDGHLGEGSGHQSATTVVELLIITE